MAQDQLPSQGGQKMAFAATGQTNGDDVLGAFDKAAVQQAGQHPAHFGRQFAFLQTAQVFALRQARLLEQPLQFALPPVLGFAPAQVEQELSIAPVLLLGLLQGAFVDRRHRAQTKGF